MDKNKIKTLEANGWRISYDPNDFLDDIENDLLPLISQVEVPDPSAYSKKGWSNMLYIRSTKHILVPEGSFN